MSKFTTAWDETKPAGTRSKLLGDDDIREFKKQYRERFAEDHVSLETEADDALVGFHNKVTLPEQGSDPLALADAIILFGKKIGSYAELQVQHENAGLIQITRLGKLWIEALGLENEAQGDLLIRLASAWGRLAKGTGLQQLRMNAGATAPEWFTPVTYSPPSGTIYMWGGDLASPPTGYLICDGSTFSATTYPDLAAVVGDKFGTHSGDNYYLPNATNCFPYGASEGGAAGNASVGSRKASPIATLTISGNDNLVKSTHSGGFGYGAGDPGGIYPGADFLPPYFAVGFIIKT